jgi:hypothetical protein
LPPKRAIGHDFNGTAPDAVLLPAEQVSIGLIDAKRADGLPPTGPGRVNSQSTAELKRLSGPADRLR